MSFLLWLPDIYIPCGFACPFVTMARTVRNRMYHPSELKLLNPKMHMMVDEIFHLSPAEN